MKVGQVLTEIASGENNMIFMDENHIYRLLPKVEAEFFINLMSKLTPSILENVISTVAVQHDIGIQKTIEQAILAHKRIKFISYPHEWCASMLKDAALFHLKLQIELLDSDLFLKDAHPWNILYEKGKFKFIDLPSITTKDKLENLEYVSLCNHKNKDHSYFNQIMKMMFVSYFLIPLCGYAYGKRSWVQKRLEQTTLNASTEVMGLRDCLPPRKLSSRNIFRFIKLLLNTRKLKKLLSYENGEIKNTLKALYTLVQRMDVAIGDSAYKNY